MQIVLHEPEIPSNTGNIARTCACTGAGLHLIRPLGFSLDSRSLKRAGLDYWDKLEIYYYDSLDDFFDKNPRAEFFNFTTKAPRAYTDVEYPYPCYLVFGKETKGLPEDFLSEHLDRCVRLPMRENLRSLNLSNTVAVAVFEALRQHGFEGLESESEYLIK